jgi:uncharacterized protein YbaP (TraB family)
MYKFLALGCCLLLGISLSTAQTAKKKTAVSNKSLLWKVSGNGLQKPTYLFGTLHVICPEDYVWTPGMQKALDACDKVAFEMDMDDPALQSKMAGSMMLKDDKTLKDFYTEEEYKKLTAVAAQHNIPIQMMQRFKPFALVSFLYLKAVACSMPDSYEGNISKLAEAGDKEILGLESVEEQMKVVDGINSDSIAKSVLHIAEDLNTFKADFNKMLAVYKNQDLPALYQLILESPDYKDDLNALLFDRNQKWIPVIAKLARQQPTFIAVGAGHLWGEKGVITLLKQQGYSVESVR